MNGEGQSILDSILRNATDAILTIDRAGRIQVVNPATTRLFGYTAGELVGQHVNLLIPASYPGFAGEETADQPNQEDFRSFGAGREALGRKKDGSVFPIHLAISQYQANGREMFAGIIRDISDLKERQAQLEAILGNAVDAILTIDEFGNIESVNPATERVFGYSVSELVGQNVKTLMPSPYQEEHDGYLKHYRETRQKKIIGVGRQVTGRRKDGSVFPMHLAVSEIQVGNRRMFTGIVRDISDLKVAENELKRLNEDLEQRVRERTDQLRETQAELLKKEKLATLGQVSGGIAHEIRNSLNAVKTSAYYLLNARNPSQDKTREHLERIDRQVTLIDNVVTALSDVARMPEPDLQELDIRRPLADVISAVAMPKNVRIIKEIPGDGPILVRADEHQIPIVLRNLVRNAREAMPDGGSLTLGIRLDNNTVTVYVADTGVGIESCELEQVMEPLYSTKARGMGLGLAISRAIVEKNGGELKVESQVDQGSVFSVVFPKPQ